MNIDIEMGSDKLCYFENPSLWQLFCSITNRDPLTPNYVWEERYVYEFILDKARKGKNDA